MAVFSGPRTVARLEDLREGVGHLVVIEGREVALFRRGATVHAIDARCPHAGGALEDGIVCGEVVVCPLHQRRVNLASGAVEDWPAPVASHQVWIEEGKVLVLLR